MFNIIFIPSLSQAGAELATAEPQLVIDYVMVCGIDGYEGLVEVLKDITISPLTRKGLLYCRVKSIIVGNRSTLLGQDKTNYQAY